MSRPKCSKCGGPVYEAQPGFPLSVLCAGCSRKQENCTCTKKKEEKDK